MFSEYQLVKPKHPLSGLEAGARGTIRKVGHDSFGGLEAVSGRSLYQFQELVRSASVEVEPQ